MDNKDFINKDIIKTNQIRTLGDGMDSNLIAANERNINKITLKHNRQLSDTILKSLQPIKPNKPVINLVPKYLPKERKQPKYLIKKPKEPKFVPYEPYKGSVQPILPRKKKIKISMSKNITKNNIDIQDLVTQMTDMRIAELNKAKINAIKSDECMISKKQWDTEKNAYETDIKNLRETNAHLENQLKFQAQVNSELKTLLVAAVGEDLETRVQHLTEDKLQLARALLNSANHLTSHQEQTEWLSGQCEVWRSKFLASSLMVEELARWKSALTKRISELQECIKNVLDEHIKVKNFARKTYNCLTGLSKHFNLNSINLKSSNILDLSNSNSDLSNNLYIKVVGNNNNLENVNENVKLKEYTFAESIALQVMQNTVVSVNKPDTVDSSLIGAAMSITAGQLYLQHPSVHATCCAHCKGEVQNI